jgi:hypothetical protein
MSGIIYLDDLDKNPISKMMISIIGFVAENER